jgi:Flp pilus assembly protein CpaB
MLKSYRARSIALAVGLAATAAVLVGLYVKNYRSHVNAGTNLVSVLVARRDIPEGTLGSRIASGRFVGRETVLKRNVMPGALVNPTRVDELVSGQMIFAGEQVSIRHFRPIQQQGVLAKISGNERGLVVTGNADQLLVGDLNTGDRVDVVANIKYTVRDSNSSSNDLRRVASRVTLRNLVVLRAAEAPKGGLGAGDTTSAMIGGTDTQVQKLFFAIKNGDWTLALRPADKPLDSPDSVETIESFLGDGLRGSQLFQLTGGRGRESISSGQ